MKHVEFTAVILASTCGARLYPLTSSTSSTCNATTANAAESMPVETQTTATTTSSSSALEGGNINNPHETFMPKHLLPLAGRPIIFHLVEHCEGIGMEQIIIAIGSEDHKLGMTQRALLSYLVGCHRVDHSASTAAGSATAAGNVDELQYGKARIAIIPLPTDCGGSADALRHVVNANVIKSSLSGKNHVMVLPSDLVLYGHVGKRNIENDNEQQQRQRDGANAGGIGSMAAACKETAPESTVDSLLYWNALGSLANVHRREYRAGLKKGMPLAMTLLLADVGEKDENGLPLKESAKAKKGGIARDEEDIEYIGISTIRNRNQPPTQRIIVKQSKYNVEEDIHNTGATPKLHIPKARLHSPMNQIMIKSSWSDLHVFCFSPWALNLLLVKDHLKELGKDFVPFLVSRQFRGLRASFGSGGGGGGVKGDDDDIVMAQGGEEKTLDALLVDTMEELNLGGKKIKRKRGSMIFHAVDDNVMRGGRGGGGASVDENAYEGDCPFMVSAHVLSRECSKLSLRACTIPSYMYACREVVTRAIASSAVTTNQKKNEFGALYVPEGTTIDDKFNCVVLPDTVIGEKVQIKSCTIGRGVSIGNRCRLNNVVVHDNVVIGENSILQNSTLSEGSIIGMNCNLNECQIGIRAEVPVGTKAKGEGF